MLALYKPIPAMGLTLDPPPQRGLRAGPTRPTVIMPCPGRPVAFADLDALARRIHTMRRGQALQLTAGVATYSGSDTFPVFKVWALGPDGDQHYLCTIAVQGQRREAVEAAIARTNPDVPAKAA